MSGRVYGSVPMIVHNLDASAMSEPEWQVVSGRSELYDPYQLPFVLPKWRCRLWALVHGFGWLRVGTVES